jgi:heterodisulfide reductase subunit C
LHNLLMSSPITPVHSPPLRRLIQEKTGQDVRRCRGCQLCNSELLSPDQDIPLDSLIQLVIMNDDEVLTCRTLWSDSVLAQAGKACVRELNLEAVLLALREEALRRGMVNEVDLNETCN